MAGTAAKRSRATSRRKKSTSTESLAGGIMNR
jgi:hypothetical protein